MATKISLSPYKCYLGRQQLTSLLLDPIDGLPLIPDDVQDRLQQINIEHKVITINVFRSSSTASFSIIALNSMWSLFQAQVAALSSELHTTRYALMNKICNQCVHQNVNPPEKQIVSDDDVSSFGR